MMTFQHDFKEAGHYVGIVTVTDDLGNSWVSRFPFTVGYTHSWGCSTIFVCDRLYGLCGFRYMLGQLAEKPPAPAAAASSN